MPLSDPRAYLGVTHARANEPARALRGTGERGTHTATCRSVRGVTLTLTHARDTHTRVQGWCEHSTLSAACRRRGDKDGDSSERAREKREERMRGRRREGGREREGETDRKKEPNAGNRGAGSGAIVELVSRPIHKRLLSVLPKISLFFFFSPFSFGRVYICARRCDGLERADRIGLNSTE